MKKMDPWSLREKMIQIGILDIALLVLSVVFLLGMLLFFGPCGIAEDGSWMTCHWAGRIIAGIAGAMVVLELLHALLPNAGIRQGLDLGALILTALAILIPGRLIDLCMMNTMRCHTVMVPAVRVFAILLAAVSVLDFVVQMGKEIRRESRRRHERRKSEESTRAATEKQREAIVETPEEPFESAVSPVSELSPVSEVSSATEISPVTDSAWETEEESAGADEKEEKEGEAS